MFLRLLAITVFVSGVGAESRVFRPASFDLETLQSETVLRDGSTARTDFVEAMTETGMVMVTNVPGLPELRRSVLTGAHTCSKVAKTAKTVQMNDHTNRTTLAGVTHGLDSAQEIEVGDDVPACSSDNFIRDVTEFRSIVAAVATSFLALLDEIFDTDGVALLWNVDGTKKYTTLEDIARAADHLEHFHSYKNIDSLHQKDDVLSIDMHADQGMFIAFIPALMIEDDEQGNARVVEGANAGDFLLQTRDGSVSVVDFGDGDGIVFMLGDGVDQYFNAKYDGPALRAAPHAMVMPEHSPNQARVWYGRMFLPPDEALNEIQGVSFGRVREMMIDAVTKGGGRGSGIGCSRKLTETEQLQCADNQIYCWMRCMNFTEDVNPGSCAQKGLGLKCLSQRNQIWRPQDSHGDYNPTCTGVPDDQFVTPAPEFSPRDETACATGFEDFMGRSNYDHAVELEPGKHWFLWSVRDELLHAKLAYNDKVGYMAIGPENVGGGLGGMYGSHIVMGIVDPDNKADPLVFGAPWIGTSVNEYVIDESNSAFRHWSTPVARRLVESEINVTSCFTSMSFVTSNIAGVPLNLTAGSTNYFIWASHTKTHLKGYHGPMGRGHLEIVLNRDDGNEPSSGVTINYSACTLWTTLVIVISVWMS